MLNNHCTEIGEPLNVHIGDLEDYTFENNELAGKTTKGYFKITFFDDKIVRVQAHYAPLTSSFSYAVIAEPQPIQVQFQDLDDKVIFKTKFLQLILKKRPFILSFQTLKGHIINEDEAVFSLTWTGQEATVYKKLQDQERFIGLGEKPGALDRRGSGHTNWNTDYFAYPLEADSIYTSFPFYIGIHHELQYGLFLDSSYKTHFNFGASNNHFSSFTTEQGFIDYYFIYGENIADILKNYGHLTGTCPLPPAWALGYQQSRYSYYPDQSVLAIAENFRHKKIPADVIYLDIHYMDKYKIFTWDKVNFSDPKTLIKKLKNLGFKVAVILNPGIKVEDSYKTYQDGCDEDIFIKYPDGSYYEGAVWPGWCHFPDFTNPKARSWWRKWLKVYTEIGVQVFWNDMNEIATWGHRLPDLIEFDFEGQKATAKHARNIYGLQMCRSTFEGVQAQDNETRPFLLTRSAYPGIQRYSSIWTGDNISSDNQMLMGIRQINSLGVTGVAFAGFDFGGFVGEADVNLYARWLTIAVFTPFLRNHTMVNTRSTEPWTFGEKVEEIARNYINFRYRLFPYLYSMFYKAYQDGLPIVKTLALDYTYDKNVYTKEYQNQYLFGDALLIVPVRSTDKFTKVYLPENKWYDLYNDKIFEGKQQHLVEAPLERLPVFVEAGSIIPMQSLQQSLEEKPEPILFLHLYKGLKNKVFTYYEDDGKSYGYKDKNYYKRKISYHTNKRQLEFGEIKGKYKTIFKMVKLYLHGFEALKEIYIDDLIYPLKRENNQFFKPISSFDPLGNLNSSEFSKVNVVNFKLEDDVIIISF